MRLNEFHVVLGADHNHSHTHVKGTIHLGFGDMPDLLQKTEHWQSRPTVSADFYCRVLRQDARDVVGESPTGDVSETLDDTLIKQSIQCSKVAEVRL